MEKVYFKCHKVYTFRVTAFDFSTIKALFVVKKYFIVLTKYTY